MSELTSKAFDCVQSMRQARDRLSAEIKRFLARTVEGRPVVEVSGYRPRVVENPVIANRVSEEASRLKR